MTTKATKKSVMTKINKNLNKKGGDSTKGSIQTPHLGTKGENQFKQEAGEVIIEPTVQSTL